MKWTVCHQELEAAILVADFFCAQFPAFSGVKSSSDSTIYSSNLSPCRVTMWLLLITSGQKVQTSSGRILRRSGTWIFNCLILVILSLWLTPASAREMMISLADRANDPGWIRVDGHWICRWHGVDSLIHVRGSGAGAAGEGFSETVKALKSWS